MWLGGSGGTGLWVQVNGHPGGYRVFHDSSFSAMKDK